jgi:holo-[acyl-carrier protein] synthase
MTLRSGVDLVEVERFSLAIERHGERFLRRIFTAAELADCANKPASLAARFAAKEAVSKALGTGIGPVAWTEIEVGRGPSREPVLRLHGAARELAQRLGLDEWSLSLSHTDALAIAFVAAQSSH